MARSILPPRSRAPRPLAMMIGSDGLSTRQFGHQRVATPVWQADIDNRLANAPPDRRLLLRASIAVPATGVDREIKASDFELIGIGGTGHKPDDAPLTMVTFVPLDWALVTKQPDRDVKP